MKTLLGLLCGIGAMLAIADASAQSWRTEPERRAYRSRDDDSRYFPEVERSTRIERPRGQKSSASARPARQQSAWTPPPAPKQADAALARCATYRQDWENVIRAEMAGGSARGAAELRARRQALYEAQLDAGC